VRRIGAVFRAEDGARTALDPAGLLQEAATIVRTEAARKEISLRVVAGYLPQILADQSQLRQCILSLLSNSFHAIEAGDHDRREVVLRADLDKPGWVRISISDSGVGIDSANVERLFDPLCAGNKTLARVGTGLLVARSIVESHGGKIWAESSTEGAAVLSFTLPVARTRQSKRLRDRQSS